MFLTKPKTLDTRQTRPRVGQYHPRSWMRPEHKPPRGLNVVADRLSVVDLDLVSKVQTVMRTFFANGNVSRLPLKIKYKTKLSCEKGRGRRWTKSAQPTACGYWSQVPSRGLHPHFHRHHNPITKQLLTQWRGELSPRIHPLLSWLQSTAGLSHLLGPLNSERWKCPFIPQRQHPLYTWNEIAFKFRDQYPPQQAETYKTLSITSH